jgi:microcystin-dependent protein
MVQQYLGEIKMAGFNFAPVGWALAAGQIMGIQQNAALFALFGTMYGGNGTTNFGLPDLQGRASAQVGPSLYTVQGMKTGTETESLTLSQYPLHNHNFKVNSGNGTATAPLNNYLAAFIPPSPPPPPHPPGQLFTPAQGAALQPLNPSVVSYYQGGSQPHENMMPYLVMNYIVAMTGVFPARG